MLEHRAPIEAAAAALRDFGAAPLAARGRLLLQVHGDETALKDSLLSQTGLQLPAPLTTSTRDDQAVLWLAPGEWLLELPREAAAAARAALLSRLSHTLVAITDVSDAFACFELRGSRGIDVLKSGCSLDLRPDQFAPGRVARTSVADVPAIIVKLQGADGFRCLVDRAFAAHFWGWLLESSARW